MSASLENLPLIELFITKQYYVQYQIDFQWQIKIMFNSKCTF